MRIISKAVQSIIDGRTVGIIIAVLFVAVGFLTLSLSNAASYATSGETEAGSLTLGATITNDQQASGFSSVRFGAPSQPVLQAGVVSDMTWGMSRADMDRSVTLMKQAGVKYIRANISWSGVESSAKGIYNTSYENDMAYGVDKALQNGIQVLIDVADGTPYWASCDPQRSNGAYNPYWRPCNFNDYADYYKRVVTLYKAKGIHTYEVGNEPNHPTYWPSGINATDYVAMLKAAYTAIKAIDPSAKVMVGGLSKGDYTYVEQLYAAGAKPYFDILAIHPYTSVDPTLCWNQAGTSRKALDAFCSIDEVRSVMVANGDTGKPLWLTEFGWSTSTADYSVTETEQADYITKAYTKLRADYPYVPVAMLYMFHDYSNNKSDWNSNTGIVHNDYSPKPSFNAFKAAAQ